MILEKVMVAVAKLMVTLDWLSAGCKTIYQSDESLLDWNIKKSNITQIFCCNNDSVIYMI